MCSESDSPDSHEIDLYDWFLRLIRSGAKMAGASIYLVRAVWLVATCTLLAGTYYLYIHKDYHIIWSILYVLVALTPVIILTIYHRILTALRQAPDQMESLRVCINRFKDEHPEEAKEVIQQKLSAIGRWRTYKLIGKILKDVLTSTSDITSLAKHFKTLTLLANPAFWISLIVTTALSVLSSAVLLCLIITVHILT